MLGTPFYFVCWFEKPELGTSRARASPSPVLVGKEAHRCREEGQSYCGLYHSSVDAPSCPHSPTRELVG
jgi:hypothetical protein